jgi:hypothetical protein
MRPRLSRGQLLVAVAEARWSAGAGIGGWPRGRVNSVATVLGPQRVPALTNPIGSRGTGSTIDRPGHPIASPSSKWIASRACCSASSGLSPKMSSRGRASMVSTTPDGSIGSMLTKYRFASSLPPCRASPCLFGLKRGPRDYSRGLPIARYFRSWSGFVTCSRDVGPSPIVALVPPECVLGVHLSHISSRVRSG